MRLVKDASGVFEGLCAGYNVALKISELRRRGGEREREGEKEWFQSKLCCRTRVVT